MGHHHIHTNVVISRIGVDGLISFADVREVLFSVLHAVGLSTHAVRNAANIGAAIAVASQTPQQWNGSMQTIINITTDAITTVRNLENPPFSTHLVRYSELQNVFQHAPFSSSPALTDNHSQSEQQPTVPPSPTTSGTTSQQNVVMEATNAIERLLPTLADTMESIVARIRNNSSSILSNSQGLAAADDLSLRLTSLSSAINSMATLITTTGHLNVFRNTEHEAGSTPTNASQPEHDSDANPASRQPSTEETVTPLPEATSSDSRSCPGHSAAQSVPLEEDRTSEAMTTSTDTGSTDTGRNGATPGGSNSNNIESASTNNMEERIRERNEDGTPRGPGTTNGDPSLSNQQQQQQTRRSDVPSQQSSTQQASNADFIVRVLSYYFCSLSDAIDVPEDAAPSYSEGQTAASVLDDLYGNSGVSTPTNRFLLVIFRVMQVLNPLQFHNVCSGDFTPLETIQSEVWHSIQTQLPNPEGLSLEPTDIEALFIDNVCDTLHEFVHILEAIQHENNPSSFPGSDDFCHDIMHIMHSKTVAFLELMTGPTGNALFAENLMKWLKDSFGEILFAISSGLHIEWDALVLLFQRAISEVGKNVVGAQFSPMFPFIANLFVTRAKVACDTTARESSTDTANRSVHSDAAHPNSCNIDLDQSICRPSSEQRRAMAQESTQEEDRAEMHSETDDAQGGDGDDSLPSPSLQECDNNEEEDDDPVTRCIQHENALAGDDMNVSRSVGSSEANNGLDEGDLDELASELCKEYIKPSSVAERSKEDSDVDLDELAKEFVEEVDSETIGQAGPSNPSLSAFEHGTKAAAGPGRRVLNVSSMASSMRQPLASSRLPLGAGHASVNRASFSSAAVPHSSSARQSDEYDMVLGMREGAKWRNSVMQDEVKMRTASHGPLSRGYRGENSSVPPLNSARASEMAVEGAREAAKLAGLSNSSAKELERTAAETSSLYLREVEKTLGSRLVTDPDFVPEKHPNAAKRFLPRR